MRRGVQEPRLIMSLDELPALRERAGSSHARHYGEMLGWLEEMESTEPPQSLWDLEEPDYSDLLEICFSLVVSCGVAHHVSEDDRWQRLAERWLERWSAFGPATGERALQSYLVAFHVMALAYGLDLFGGRLASDLSDSIRSVLTAEVGTMVDGMVSGECGWSRRYHYHDCWVPVFGLGIGCLALQSDEPRAGKWLEAVEREVDWIWSIQDADGAWNEGVAPLNYALGPPLFYLEGRKRLFDEDAFDIPWLQGMPRWRAYHLLADDTYVYLDDSTPSGRYHGETGGVVAYQLYKIASECHDGLAQWQALKESARTFPKDYHDQVWSFLWYDPSVEPAAPDSLPRSAYFPSWGQFFSRSGFDNSASVMTFECCEPGGKMARDGLVDGLPAQTITQNKHAHYRERGSFSFFAGGAYHLRPSGYFRFDTELKNALTFDGQGQSDYPATGGSITGVHTGDRDGYGAARCEASSAYPDVADLASWERTVLHAQDQDAMFVLDRVRFADGAPHQVTAHFHVGHEVGVIAGDEGSVLCRAANDSRFVLRPVTRAALAVQQVPQPVDPYWREYLSSYDIPPADLEAMDQVDLQFGLTTGSDGACDVLWAVTCEGEGVSGHAAEGGATCVWWSPSGDQLVAVVVLPEITGAIDGVPVELPTRPGTVFVMGGEANGTVSIGLDPRDGSSCLLHVGTGETCRLTDAGTGRVTVGRA